MLKVLLIVGLVFYGLYKFGSLFYKAGAASQQVRNPQDRKPATPNPEAKVKKGSNFKGGEYVDYEEVK
jgi:hypothetical protein